MRSIHRKNTSKYIVITSINQPNDVLRRYASLEDWKLILVGDRSGPHRVDDKNIIFLDMDTQANLELSYARTCPENHYARKNIGYLYAISLGAEIIAETDDDNMPKKDWGENIEFRVQDLNVISETSFFNVYAGLTAENIWPRGFPLEWITQYSRPKQGTQKCRVGVWQHLVDNHPDVDAIYRLTNNRSVIFKPFENFALAEHVYCPFNSQNTFWCRETFPLMYLPKSVTFRFTDILRGYVAQRLMWEKNLLLGIGSASVWQERNGHDLFRDFLEEVPMYQKVTEIVNSFESLSFSGNFLHALYQSYEELVREKIVDKSEITALEAWVKDLETIEEESGQFH